MAKQALLFLVALCAAFASGCMPMNNSSGGMSVNERLDNQEEQLRALAAQVGQVEQVLPAQAETWSQVQKIQEEFAKLKGQVDNLSGGGSLGSLRERMLKLENAVALLGSQMGVDVGSAPARSTPTSTASAPSSSSSSKGAQGLYDSGIKAFDERRYNDAILAFQDFTAANPKHKLAGNAHFWTGESYYQNKDYARAALAYQEVIAGYSGSAKMQSALLKQGMALYYAGKKPAGKERLNELVSRYPNSPEATRAKSFLEKNK